MNRLQMIEQARDLLRDLAGEDDRLQAIMDELRLIKTDWLHGEEKESPGGWPGLKRETSERT